MIYLLTGLAALCAAVLYIAARAGDDKGEDMPNFYYDNDGPDYEDMILARQEAREIWEDLDPLTDDLDEFLREIYDDVMDDLDLDGMLEEWESDDEYS